MKKNDKNVQNLTLRLTVVKDMNNYKKKLMTIRKCVSVIKDLTSTFSTNAT